jgi:hypothetical protein
VQIPPLNKTVVCVVVSVQGVSDGVSAGCVVVSVQGVCCGVSVGCVVVSV